MHERQYAEMVSKSQLNTETMETQTVQRDATICALRKLMAITDQAAASQHQTLVLSNEMMATSPRVKNERMLTLPLATAVTTEWLSSSGGARRQTE